MDEQGVHDPALQQIFGQEDIPEDKMKELQKFLKDRYGIDDIDTGISELKSELIVASELNGIPKNRNWLKNSGRYFRNYGAQEVKGFGYPVKMGFAHNASLATAHMDEWVLDTLFRIEFEREKRGSVKGGAVLFECTELPAYSNAVRMSTRLPVWDITTLGQCLMAAVPTYNPDEHISENPAFKRCLMAWRNPYKLEPRFGKTANGTILGYTPKTTPARPLDEYDWGLLGKPTGARCTKDIGCAA